MPSCFAICDGPTPSALSCRIWAGSIDAGRPRASNHFRWAAFSVGTGQVIITLVFVRRVFVGRDSVHFPLSNLNSVRPLISVGRRPHLIEEQAFGWGRRGAPLGGPKQSAKQPLRHFLVDSSPLQGPLGGVCHARHELGLTCLLGARLLPIWSPAAIHY